MRTWRTVALATGEEPISTDTSQTGISTRILEIYGGPFNDEKSASLMHQQAGMNCGWAGPYFIEKLMELGSEALKQKYEMMYKEICDLVKDVNGSHMSGITTVALADFLIDTWIFRDNESTEQSDNLESWIKAIKMAETIMLEQAAENSTDVNEHAVQYIVDWILSNEKSFGKDACNVCYGFIDDEYAYVYPSIFNQMLKNAGFSARKTTKYLAENGIIENRAEQGKQKYSVVKWFRGRAQRFVKIHFLRKEVDDNSASNDFHPVSEVEQQELPF